MAINKKLFIKSAAGGITPSDHFNPVLFTGNSTTVSTGFNASTEGGLFWVSNRNNANGNLLIDSIRGVQETFFGNENYNSLNRNSITAFNSSSVTIGNYSSITSGGANVLWSFRGGGTSNDFNVDGTGYATASAAGLTAGNTTPTKASVNTASGFSMIQYAGSGASNQSIPHGLSNCEMILVKNIGSSTDWQSFGEPLFDRMQLNNDGGDDLSHGFTLNSTTFTSPSLVASEWNASGQNYMAYCFTSISGYSSLGTYTGAVGKEINLGFQPRFALIKRTSSAYNWLIYDSVRGSSGALNDRYAILVDSGASTEQTSSVVFVNFTSTGLDFPNSYGGTNETSAEYFYMAIA
jgi:hypothetical protein